MPARIPHVKLAAVLAGRDQTPRPVRTSAPGSSASAHPGSHSFDPRIPDPMTTFPSLTTGASTSTGHPEGSPIGVIPPYSIPVSEVTNSTDPNEALRAPRCRRTSPFTSARVVAVTRHAANELSPPRLAATTTQFTDSSGATPYRSQNAAVSASAGSIAATRTASAAGQERSAA